MMCCRVSDWGLPEWRPDADQTLGASQGCRCDEVHSMIHEDLPTASN